MVLQLVPLKKRVSIGCASTR